MNKVETYFFNMLKLRAQSNRTAKYLGKSINLYGKTFLSEVKKLTDYVPSPIGQSIVKYSIMDLLYYRAKKIDQFKTYLFLTFDKKGPFEEKKGHLNKKLGLQRFCNFLSYVRKHGSYVDDYWNDKDTHTVVMKFPIANAYEKFLISHYSKMYSLSELKEVGFSPIVYIDGQKYKSADYIVLTHAKDYGKVILESVVYENYGVKDIADDPDEFDIPWLIQDEISNSEYIVDYEKEQIQLMKKQKEYHLYDQSGNISRFN